MNDSAPKETPAAVRTPLDRIFDFLERFWKSRKEPVGLYQRVLKWIRRGVASLNILYLVALAGVLLLLEFYGERNLTLCFLLFLPAQGWLMPLFGLIPINLLIHPRWALSAIPAILMVLWLYMDWQLRAWDDTDAPTLVVMTNNVGQNNKQSMRPFLNAHGPTIIALQEAGRKAAFERDYPEWKVEAWGEFTLLSKHPIISVTPIENAKWQDQVVAVRFVVDWDGTKIAVYNVHLPSPRDEIKALTGKPLALGMIGFGSLKDKRIAYHQPWLDRVATSKQLAHMVDSDNLPALLVGDLNFPNHGAAYHAVTETLIDAFEERGKAMASPSLARTGTR